MPRYIWSKLSLACLMSSTVAPSSALATAVHTARAVGLIARQDRTCPLDRDLLRCGAELPAEFCCPESSNCLSLGDDSSVICCPAGQDCKLIEPITCDITQQNATAHPSHAIHTTNLSATLPKCGDLCCPLGYTCRDERCEMDDQERTPQSPQQSASATSALSIGPTSPVQSGALPSASESPACDAPDYPARAVLAGFFPGIVLGIILTVAGMFLIRKYGWAQNAGSPSTITSLGPRRFTGRSVSEPISHPHFGNRTDFLLRPTTNSSNGSKASSPTAAPAPASTFSFPFSSQSPARHARPPSSAASPSVYPATPTPAPLTVHTTGLSNRFTRPPLPIRALFTRTPPLPPAPTVVTQGPRHHSTSSETIDVLMQPQMGLMPPPKIGDSERRNTANTTFSALMEGAGVGGGMASRSNPSRRS